MMSKRFLIKFCGDASAEVSFYALQRNHSSGNGPSDSFYYMLHTDFSALSTFVIKNVNRVVGYLTAM